jgi:hypothetical protein
MDDDFRKYLPIVENGSVTDFLAVTVKQSKIWAYAKQFKLHRNMRANLGETSFKELLSDIGEDKQPAIEIISHESLIEIPTNMIISDGAKNELVDFIFGVDSNELTNDNVSTKNVAVLCPKNEDALAINEDILNRSQVESKTYLSEDVAEHNDESEFQEYPLEFLHSYTPNNLPLHVLNLKVGAMILIKNININEGLCNSTRLVVKR